MAYYFPQLIIGLRYPVLLIAILGIVQFYVSPGIFGFIDLSGPVDPYVQRATSDVFPYWMVYLRATSILASPQFFGLFMILYAILFLLYAKRRAFDWLLISVYLFAGAHSGNKSFFLILLLSGGYYIWSSGRLKNKITAVCVFLFLLLMVLSFSDEVAFLGRIVDIENIADEEEEGSLSIYRKFLGNATFWGDGTGSHQTFGGDLQSIEVCESYFLQVLVELGVIPFVFFC